MVTREENDMMTRVGRGQPAGELLRRYWQPVAAAAELSAEKPIMRVRLLGENLVLYRSPTGSYGLVEEQCPHYHGWKFNGAGRCLEQPAEPAQSTYKDEVTIDAYPVQKLGGMLFAYLGPLPAPALPRWDVLAWENGRRWVVKQTMIDCNWLQAMENSVDPAHLYWLHGATAHLAPELEEYGEEHDFIAFEHGIMKRRTEHLAPCAAHQNRQSENPAQFAIPHAGRRRAYAGLRGLFRAVGPDPYQRRR
jgi:5,5'-dehydrodivanillate O-demethylase oxygenase subunit